MDASTNLQPAVEIAVRISPRKTQVKRYRQLGVVAARHLHHSRETARRMANGLHNRSGQPDRKRPGTILQQHVRSERCTQGPMQTSAEQTGQEHVALL